MMTSNAHADLIGRAAVAIDTHWYYSWHWDRDSSVSLTVKGWKQAVKDAERVIKMKQESIAAILAILPELKAQVALTDRCVTPGPLTPGPLTPGLCYVDGAWAYFTTHALDQQWGDGWGDAPYEYNAGEPYEALGSPITKIAWEGELEEPCTSHLNSPYCVRDINNQTIPWLQTYDKNIQIWAGCTITKFCTLVSQASGTVYKEVT